MEKSKLPKGVPDVQSDYPVDAGKKKVISVQNSDELYNYSR